MTNAIIAAHTSNYSIGRNGKKIDRIVIHYTAGDGDTARNNGNYFARANRDASAHYFVDENEVIQSVGVNDTAWHSGNWTMNQRSIGVEMCSRKNSKGMYYIPDLTIARTQELVRYLMGRFGVSIDGVIRHYDVTGKLCPEPFVRNPALWEAFKDGLKEKSKMDKNAPPAWAKEACEWAIKKGMLKGDENGNMNWDKAVTRAELAIILQRAMGGA